MVDLFQTPGKYDIFICHRKTYDTLFLDVKKCVDSESAVHFVVRDRFQPFYVKNSIFGENSEFFEKVRLC